MILPEHCSLKTEGKECPLAPSYVVSVVSDDGEYMLAVVCDDHRSVVEQRLRELQDNEKIRKGRIKFESIMTVVTDCIVGLNDDYVDLELKRGVESDRKIV
ncbi:MAG TPA: hypothetical protein VLA68_03865 [Nitrososphaera sp.]|nr:hypothetical protein [Nitrososphaera sp.]